MFVGGDKETVALTSHFLTEIGSIALNYLRQMSERNNKVLDFHHPHQMREVLSHYLELHAEARDLEQILSDCRETLKYGVKTGNLVFKLPPFLLNMIALKVIIAIQLDTNLAFICEH
ncbi:unnamed protein product [Protopolystoma xenopodis]|uniref:Uncharacterized protein n=1 Tax=Protopolystoma xenopodis TaxID=117903 RepID=A0A3S5AEN8_9PLAT|nr:unnamed protein product [Protopolystoma xenopodis]